MFKIFISESSLENLLLEESSKKTDEQNYWYKILERQKNIYVLFNKGIDYDSLSIEEAQLNPLFIFQQGGKTLVNESDYIEAVTLNPERTLDEPCGAFLLDIAPEKAKEIQNKYGVICQSVDSLDGNFWTSDIYNAHPVISENDSEHSWEQILQGLDNMPSNAILIIDRNLFNREDKYKTTIQDGIDNLFSILKSVLPKSFSPFKDFHVLVIFDGSELEHAKNTRILFEGDQNPHSFEETFKELAKTINRRKKDLSTSYTLTIELLSITKDNIGYEYTHNRRVLSNYFMIRVDHLLKAFKNNLGSCPQRIDCETLFATGLERLSKSDTPEKEHANLLKDLKKALDDARGAAAPNYHYAINKNTGKSVKELQNRLFS